MTKKKLSQSQKLKLLVPLFSPQLEDQQERSQVKGNALQRKCLLNLEQNKEEVEKITTRATPQKITVALKDKKRTRVDRKTRHVLPLLRKVQVTVDHPAARARRKAAPTPSIHVITGPAHESSGAITAKSPDGPTAAHQGGENDAAAAGGAIVAKPPAAAPTPAVLGAPQQEVAPTVTAAAVTPTATVTTALKAADGGALNVHLTQSMSGGAVEVAGDPEDINTPLHPQMIPALVLAATAGGSGTGGTTTAAREAPAAGAAAPAQDPGGGAIAGAEAQQVAPPVPTRAHLTDGAPGVVQTATHIAETSTALGFIARSLPARHHEASTGAPTHPLPRL